MTASTIPVLPDLQTVCAILELTIYTIKDFVSGSPVEADLFSFAVGFLCGLTVIYAVFSVSALRKAALAILALWIVSTIWGSGIEVLINSFESIAREVAEYPAWLRGVIIGKFFGGFFSYRTSKES